MSTTLAEVFPVGEYLADELAERGWTQAEFAEILGRPPQFVSEIISGKKEITRESATQIAAAFGTSPEVWLNLQDAYHLWHQASDQGATDQLEEVRLRARLAELAPIRVLLNRGFIRGSTPQEQRVEIEALYDIASIDDEPDFAVAARRSSPNSTLSSHQLAWIACVRHRAEGLPRSPYDKRALAELGRHLTRYVTAPADMAGVPALFAAVGVRLVHVEAFPSSRIDGCSFLHSDGTPVIGVSGRGKRLDKVLFTILHEAAHVVLDHLEDAPLILDEGDSEPEARASTLGQEGPANQLAGEWALPGPVGRLPERITRDWIKAQASAMGIHPIILVGRLQSDGRLPWRTLLAKGAPNVDQELRMWP